MRIVINSFNFSGNDSGIGIILKRVVNHLSKNHEVFVISQRLNLFTGKDLPKEDVLMGASVLRLKRSKIPIISSISYYLRVLYHIRKFKPDVCFDMGVYGIGMFSKFFFRIPYATMGQGSDIYTVPFLFRKLITKPTLAYADAVIANTDHLSEFFKENYGVKTISFIPNGVDTSFFSPVEKNKEPRIIAVGRLIESKNFQITLAAMPYLLEEFPTLKFFIIGTGVYEQTLRDLVTKLGIEDSVVFLGQKPHAEVISHLLKSSVFVYPTAHVETCSLALLEAMAAGLPIVTSNVQSNGDLVIEGKGGFLVPIKDPEQLANRVLMLLKNPLLREQFGEFNKKRVQVFDWKIVLKKYEDLLVSLIREE